MKTLVLALVGAGLSASGQQPAFDQLASRFEVDSKEPTDVTLRAVWSREGVQASDFSFASAESGRVPGLLVLPDRPGQFPVILFGHWMMNGSPKRNHTEFLDEAIVYARAGAICVLLDNPLVRAGVKEDPDWRQGQAPKAALQMAREWRRALDILTVRKDVDAKRVAYVGHSFGAGVGAKLVGVEKRIGSFVLLANTYSIRDLVYDEQNAEMVAMRKAAGEDAIREYLREFAWDDSELFVRHSAPAAVFLQNGRLDQDPPERAVRKSFEYFQQPKQLRFYEAGHALNAAATMDRGKWLQRRLKLKRLDLRALGLIELLR